MNDQIRVPQVRLIGADGSQMGVVPVEEALKRAQSEEFDLVEISPTANPPVCRIMDFGKFKYQQQKKDHEQKRKQHGMELKQIRVKSIRIDPHDIEIKRNQARNFLEAGHRVVFTMMFRARENQHSDLGEAILKDHFAARLADISKVDSPPAKDGKKMNMSLSPLPNLRQILDARARTEKKAMEEKLREEKAMAEPALEPPAPPA